MALTTPETDLDNDIYGLNMSYMKNLNIMRKKLNLREIATNDWDNTSKQSTSYVCDMVPEKLEQENEINKPSYNERDFESRTSIRSNLHLSRRETHLDLASYMRLQDIENAYKLSNINREAMDVTKTSCAQETVKNDRSSKTITPRTLEVPPKRVCLDQFTNSATNLHPNQIPEMYSATKCTQMKDKPEAKKTIKKQTITKKIDHSSSAPISRKTTKELITDTRSSQNPKRKVKPIPKTNEIPKQENMSSSEENLMPSASTTKTDLIEDLIKKEKSKPTKTQEVLYADQKNVSNTKVVHALTSFLLSKPGNISSAKENPVTSSSLTETNLIADTLNSETEPIEDPTLFHSVPQNVPRKASKKQIEEENSKLSFIKVHSSISGIPLSKLTQIPQQKISQATLTEQKSQMTVKGFIQANIDSSNLVRGREATIQIPSTSDLNRNEFSSTKQTHQFSQTNCFLLKLTASKLSLTPFNHLLTNEEKFEEEETVFTYTSSSDKFKSSIRSSEEVSSDVNLPSSVQDISKIENCGVRVVTLTDDEVTIETRDKQENDDILNKYLEPTPVLSSISTPDTLQVSTCVSSGAASAISHEIIVRNLDGLSSVSTWKTDESNDTTTSVATPKLSSIFKEYLSDYSVKHGGFVTIQEKHSSYADFKENAMQMLRELKIGEKRRNVLEASKKYDIPDKIALTPYDDTRKEGDAVSKGSKDIACSRKAQDTDYKYYCFSSEESEEVDDVRTYLKAGSEAETEQARGFCDGCFCWGMLFSVLIFCALYM